METSKAGTFNNDGSTTGSPVSGLIPVGKFSGFGP